MLRKTFYFGSKVEVIVYGKKKNKNLSTNLVKLRVEQILHLVKNLSVVHFLYVKLKIS